MNWPQMNQILWNVNKNKTEQYHENAFENISETVTISFMPKKMC